MATPTNTVDEILNNLDAIILNFVQGSFGSLSGPVETLWKAMLIVFIAIYGYKVIINGRFSTHDGLVHIAKMIAILVLATSWTEFQIFIMDLVTDTPSDIAGQVIQGTSGGGSTTETISTALGDFYETSMKASSDIMNTGGNIFARLFNSWAVWLAALALTAYALMLVCLSKIAVAVLLSVGPFFILMLIFAQTKTLFEGWLRTLLNYALIPLFVYTLLALLLSLVSSPLSELDSNISATSSVKNLIAPFLLISAISVMLLMQIMNFASGIAGGISLQTMGLGRYAANKIGAGAKTGGKYARYRADQAANATGRGVKRAAQKGAESIKTTIQKLRENKQ